MAVSPKNIFGGMKAYYDKLFAVLVLMGLLGSLSYLVIRAGMMKSFQREFERRVQTIKPKHPKADKISDEEFTRAANQIQVPARLMHSSWTNKNEVTEMFVAETRVWCRACKGLIAYNDDNCPFCGEENPGSAVHIVGLDSDGDGMPNVWEQANGLNYQDKTDADKDKDGDLFTNLEEYKQKTNPGDPEDHLPYEDYLFLANIRVVPFHLLFKSSMKLPGRSVMQIPKGGKLFPEGKMFYMDIKYEILVPNGSSFTLPDKTEFSFTDSNYIKFVNRLDFKIVRKTMQDGKEQEEGLKEFKLFEESEITLPEGSMLVVKGKKPILLDKGTTLKPVFNYKFGLNTKRGSRTHFVRIGEDAEGFKVLKHEIIKEGYKDKSKLILQRGKKIITLVKDREHEISDFIVFIGFSRDPSWKAGYGLMEGNEEFTLRGTKYQLLINSIDTKEQSVVIQRDSDKKEFTLKIKAQSVRPEAEEEKQPEPDDTKPKSEKGPTKEGKEDDFDNLFT